MKAQIRYPTPAAQSGIALIIGLLILLVLTIIGITAIRSTTQQERMSAANQQQTQTFQAAESGIQLVMDLLTADTTAGVPTNASLVSPAVNDILVSAVSMAGGSYPTSSNPTIPIPNSITITPATNSASTNLASTIYTASTVTTASSSGIAVQTYVYVTGTGPVAGASYGKFSQFNFSVDSNAAQTNTGASTRNIQGVGYISPKQSTFN